MSDFLDWSTLIYRAPALLVAMALHEYAHAYVSDSLGDPTPSMQGRLTANPLVHLDMVGLMLLVIYSAFVLRFRLGKTGGDQSELL